MEGFQSSVAPKPQTRLSTIEIAVDDAVSSTKQLATLRLADQRNECQANPVAIRCPFGSPTARGWYAGIVSLDGSIRGD